MLAEGTKIYIPAHMRSRVMYSPSEIKSNVCQIVSRKAEIWWIDSLFIETTAHILTKTEHPSKGNAKN